MKTNLLAIALVMSSLYFGQDSLKIKSALFTVNPQKFTAKNTTGINVGIMDDYLKQNIYGINLQANPISLIYPLIPKALPVPSKESSTVTVSGLHFSTGGMVDGEKLNGLGISIYHHCRITNGVSVNFYNNTSATLNGVHISGFANNSIKGNGLSMAFLGNYSEDFAGMQVAAFNESKKMKGMQIGLVNKSKEMKGLQIGFWNENEKRKLPLINWNFKSKKEKS